MQDLADAEVAATGKGKAAKKDAAGSKGKAVKGTQAAMEQKSASKGKFALAKRNGVMIA